MGVGDWIGLSGLLLTQVGSVYLTYNNFNRKISRTYERFDEYKEHIEGKIENQFVHKDMCGLLHAQTAGSLAKIESNIYVKLDNLQDLTARVHTDLAVYAKQIEINTKRLDKLEAINGRNSI